MDTNRSVTGRIILSVIMVHVVILIMTACSTDKFAVSWDHGSFDPSGLKSVTNQLP